MARSKERIIKAAFELFNERSFDKITVNDILDRAYVSRGTFYKYFSDKYELLYLYYADVINRDILSSFNGHNWDELQASCYQFGYDNKIFFRHLRNSSAADDFWTFMQRFSYNIFRIIKLHNSGKESLEPSEILTIDAYVNTAIFLFKKLVFEECALSPQEISDIAYRSLPDEYKIVQVPTENMASMLLSEMDRLW